MNFKYKAVFIDLDGTLLNSNKEISPRNLACLQKLYHAGVHIIISTGRTLRSVQIVAKNLHVSSPLIVLNGGQICESLFSKSIKIYYTPNSLRDNIYAFCRHIVKDFKHFRVENILIDTAESLYALYPNISNMDEFSSHYDVPPHAFDPFNPPLSPVVGVLFLLEDNTYHNLFLETYRKFDPENLADVCTFNGWSWLEISCKNINKGRALKDVCEYLSINPLDTIAFGDGHNDVDMLRYAGLGVAMANADSYAIAAADTFTLSNNDDGVAVFLESLFSSSDNNQLSMDNN